MAKGKKKDTATDDTTLSIPFPKIATASVDRSYQGHNVPDGDYKSGVHSKMITNEDDDVGSVIEFSESIDDAEAPLPIPEGVYMATIKDVRTVTRKTSGKRGIDIIFRIAPEDYPADFPVEEAPDGATLVYRRINFDDTKASRFALKRFMGNIGAPPIGRRLDISEIKTQWVGLPAKITVKHDEWEGAPRPNIDRVLAAA